MLTERRINRNRGLPDADAGVFCTFIGFLQELNYKPEKSAYSRAFPIHTHITLSYYCHDATR